jgi:trimeric autotransporter adhesin
MPIDAAVLNALLDSWRPYPVSGSGPTTIAYEFMTELPADSAPPEAGAAGFEPAAVEQQAALRAVFDAIESVTNVRFVQSGTGSAVGPVLRIGRSTDVGGTNWRDSGAGGVVNDVYLPPQDPASLTPGARGFFDVMALVEQALGLKRPDDSVGDTLPTMSGTSGTDSQAYTVLSGNAAPEHDLGGGLQAYAQTPLVYDVAALQAIYGANAATGAGDGDVYDVSNVALDEVRTIWDAGGEHDRIDASGATGNVVLDLNEGALSSVNGVGNVSIAYGGPGNENPIEDATGGAGGDTLIGNAKANVLDGGASADTMIGGDGDDTYFVDHTYDTVIEADGGGNDTVVATFSTDLYFHRLADGAENLEVRIAPDTFRALTATGNSGDNRLAAGDEAQVRLYGEDGADTLIGGNWLDGGAGADIMAGGRGSDRYYVDDAGDVVIEVDDGGLVDGGGYFYEVTQSWDTVYSQVSFTLGSNLEALELTGSANADGSGNELANTILGNSGDNVLRGNASGLASTAGDYLMGRGGNDQLFADDGASQLYGDSGNDQLFGGAGNDMLDGGEGGDVMSGGGGDDTYYVDSAEDVIVEAADGGFDQVNSTVTLALADNFESLNLRGYDAIDGTGNASANAIYGNDAANAIHGGDGNDILDGLSGADSLYGDAGDDVLYGNGLDLLDGGSGDDTYFVYGEGNTIVEGADSGIDSVVATSSHVLADNVEDLTLSEGYLADGTGNAGANNIFGNNYDNVLRGLGGDDRLDAGNGWDTLVGGAGDDVLIGGAGNDVYVFGRGDGHDVAEDAAGFDELHLTGGLRLGDIAVRRADADLVVDVIGGGDNITLRNWFVSGQAIDAFRFDDGTVLDTAGIEALLSGNRAPDALNDFATISADAAGPVTGNVLSNDADPDPGTTLSLVDAGSLSGSFGTLTFATDGGYSYVLAGSITDARALGSTEVLTETFSYTVTDGAADPMYDSAALTVTIQGVNDAPVAVDDLAEVSEDGLTIVSGNVLANDVEFDAGQLLSVAAAGVFAGQYGSLFLGADGAYTYMLDNTSALVQSLKAGQEVVESFSYAVRDDDAGGALEGQGLVQIRISGRNDAPGLTRALEDASTMAGTAFSLQIAADAFADVDGDALTLAASLGNGAALPSWLQFDASTRTFSGTPSEAGITSIRVTATDASGASVADEFDLTVGAVQSGRDIFGTWRNDSLRGASGDDRVYGREGSDVLDGGGGNDLLDGGRGNDLMVGGTGDDRYVVDSRRDTVVERANEGNDTVTASVSWRLGDHVENLVLAGGNRIDGVGNGLANHIVGNSCSNALSGGGGNDFLEGGRGDDTLHGGSGIDILDGGRGNDRLTDTDGPSVLLGGSGNDTLQGGAAASFYAGGRGDDTIKLGSGHDVVAFNRGDGRDTVLARGGDATLSLGAGVRYEDLKLRRDGASLVLATGSGESITLKDWYSGTGNRGVANLQVVAQAVPGYAPDGANPLLDDRIETFDFRQLVQAFDEATAGARHTRSWSLMNELLDAHVSGSDSEALGGDLAYRYGLDGALSGMPMDVARNTVSDAAFGSSAQPVRPLSETLGGMPRLA